MMLPRLFTAEKKRAPTGVLFLLDRIFVRTDYFFSRKRSGICDESLQCSSQSEHFSPQAPIPLL